jgi:hypothetical protein
VSRGTRLEIVIARDFVERGESGPMNTAPSQENVAQSLEIIAKYVSADPAGAPAQFVMELAHQWKLRGGLVAGKPRHSDRYLDALLRRNGTPIRSLTPKLAGKTQIKPGDAEELVRLFLTLWDYAGDPHSGEIAPRPADIYKPLFAQAEIEGICAYVADRIAEVGPEGRSAPETAAAHAAPGQDMLDLIEAEFQEAVAYFQIGAGRTLLLTRPDQVYLGFRDIIDRLWKIESADGPARILIWTLDLGRQDFEDPESRLRFMNVQELIARFKVMRQFKDGRADADQRWKWLQSRSVVVLHDTKSGRPEIPRLPSFDPNHVLFSAIPPLWAETPEFQTLYGTQRLRETNYSIFLKRKREPSAGKTERREYELHYFGHALLRSDDKGDPPPTARTLKLMEPGRSYVEALGTVFQASVRTLDIGNVPPVLSVDGMRIDSDGAIEKLRHHGFHLLRLDEFMMRF